MIFQYNLLLYLIFINIYYLLPNMIVQKIKNYLYKSYKLLHQVNMFII